MRDQMRCGVFVITGFVVAALFLCLCTGLFRGRTYPTLRPSLPQEPDVRTVRPRRPGGGPLRDLLHSATDDLSVVTLRNVETCLNATNMLDYLHHEGLLNDALKDAKLYLMRIRSLIPSIFLSSLSNHCWKVDVKLKSISTHMVGGQYGSQAFFINRKELLTSQAVQRSLHSNFKYSLPMACVPEIFIAGFPKCGSTYLYDQVTSHPSIISPREKEPHWWVRPQHFTSDADYRNFYFVKYVLNYGHLVQQFLRTSGKSRLLSVDSSPSKMFSWPALSGGKTDRHGVDYCLLPAVIPQILPRAKFIVVMRNPVDMLYSAFWYSCTHKGGDVPMEIRPKGRDIFHDRLVQKIKAFNLCVRNQSLPLAKCAITVAPNIFSSELHCGRSRIEMGLYYVHVQKWLSVVPRSKFLFLTLEELSADTNGVMANVWTFLDLPQVTLNLSRNLRSKHQQVKVDYRHDPQLAMRTDTRKLLKEFFAPYNRMLADLLEDDKFLWDSPVR